MFFYSISQTIATWLVIFGLLFQFQIQAEAGRLSTESGTRSYEHHEVDLDDNKHDEQFFTFVTRPELNAPRWDIHIYNETSLSPGHWFVAPYQYAGQSEKGAAWIAPNIYDRRGELIWSGAAMFGGWSAFDFRVVNIMGKSFLSLIDYHVGTVYILDDTYAIYKTIDIGDSDAGLVNMHEFATFEQGTRALHLIRDDTYASRTDSNSVGFGGECFVDFDGFRELRTDTWEPQFLWTSRGHIGLNESYAIQGSVNDRCSDANNAPWEAFHLNSVDKFPDGDYLVSGRRTFALYKISHIDGSIVWRLGGKMSDFQLNIGFSGQHSARVHTQNETHTIISILDNSFYKDYIAPTYKNSRGILLALRTDTRPMRTETLMTFDRPDLEYTTSRGNMEVLSNGNAWICWSHNTLHSEHSASGTLIMEARLKAGFDTYRSFKSPWNGRPHEPPDVHAVAVRSERAMQTVVHVSWNGATGVAKWKIWHTDPAGRKVELVGHGPRSGFETTIVTEGLAGYIVAEAIDSRGVSMGESEVFQTLLPDDQLDDLQAVEANWQEDHIPYHLDATTALFAGVVVSGSVLVMALGASRTRIRKLRFERGRERREYHPLPQEDMDEFIVLAAK